MSPRNCAAISINHIWNALSTSTWSLENRRITVDFVILHNIQYPFRHHLFIYLQQLNNISIHKNKALICIAIKNLTAYEWRSTFTEVVTAGTQNMY